MELLFIQNQTNWYNIQSEKLKITRQRMVIAKMGRTINLVDNIVKSLGGSVNPLVKKQSDYLMNLADDYLILKSNQYENLLINIAVGIICLICGVIASKNIIDFILIITPFLWICLGVFTFIGILMFFFYKLLNLFPDVITDEDDKGGINK